MRSPFFLLLLGACATPNVEVVRVPTLAEITKSGPLELEGREPAWAKAAGPFIVDGAVYAVGSSTVRNYHLAQRTSHNRAAGSLTKWSGSYVSARSASNEVLTTNQLLGLVVSQIHDLEWVAVWRDPTGARVVSLVRVQKPIISIFDGQPALVSALYRRQAEVIERVSIGMACGEK